MLASLRIENFAIIEEVSIDFNQGMTVLSGETGAGKSIIIDALSILSGGRGSVDLIRHASEKFVVEGLFTSEDHSLLNQLLKDLGYEIDLEADDLLIRRELNRSGRNIIRINGQLANVSTLKTIGGYLVDIHGQNEHQALLDQSQHLDLLDQYAGEQLSVVKSTYQEVFMRYSELRKELLHAHRNEQEQAQQLNFLQFQLQELEELDLQVEEEEELLTQSKRLQHAQVMSQNVQAVNDLMTENELSVDSQLERVKELLADLIKYDPSYQAHVERLESLQIDLQEVASEIAFSFDMPDYDEAAIDELESRLSQIEQIKRKYVMTVDELLAYQNQIAEDIYQITHREQYLAKLDTQFIEVYQEASSLAQEMSLIRKNASGDLIKQIEAQLKDLYMAQSQFEVKFDNVSSDEKIQTVLEKPLDNMLRLTESGIDRAEFYVATNLGEQIKPLVRVASGGELSRFMLALKTVFSKIQNVETLVFDEIDTGVSGRVASAIANKMAEVGRYAQVLCITHLPQVAAAAANQLAISKQVVNQRTTTKVESLDQDSRLEIIARMMAGEEISSSSIELAQELIDYYHKGVG